MNGLKKLISAGVIAVGLMGLLGCDKEKDAQVERVEYASLRYRPASALSLACGDIDGDGVKELIVADARVVKAYRADGKGKFVEASIIVKPDGVSAGDEATSRGAVSVVLDDVNKDGYIDLIMGDQKGIAVFYNDGKGNFHQ